jgi:hypothetical protein
MALISATLAATLETESSKITWYFCGISLAVGSFDEFAGTNSLAEAPGTRHSEKDGGKADGKENDLHGVRCPSF